MISQQDSHPSPPSPVFNQAMKAALDLLAHRGRAEHEVRSRLESRFSKEIAEQVIDALRSRSLVNDARFARSWREQRERRRPRGRRLIRQELLDLGVAPSDVEQALDGFDAEANASRAARAWWAKQPSKGALDYPKLRRRLWGYLERRGFEGELIGRTVQNLCAELSHPQHGQVDAEADEYQCPNAEEL